MKKNKLIFYSLTFLLLFSLFLSRQIVYGQVIETGDATGGTEICNDVNGTEIECGCDPTSTPTPTPITCQEVYTCSECLDYPNQGSMCSRSMHEYCNETYDCESKDNEWSCDCEVITPTPTVEPSITPTPTVESTPTPTPSNPGGPGDGLSDGRSDGRSSCPECTQAPKSAAVLGASIGPAVLGLSTTSGEQNIVLQLVQLFGALASGIAGYTFFKKNA